MPIRFSTSECFQNASLSDALGLAVVMRQMLHDDCAINQVCY